MEESFLEGMIMANNGAQGSAGAESLALRRGELSQRRERLGSYAALADELGVNVRYVYDFVMKGCVPASRRVREAMGIYVASRGKRIYDRRSALARAKGWSGLSEALTALDRGDWELPRKADVYHV